MHNDTPAALLPYLWLVWSDDLLTANEINTLKTFIRDLDGIEPDARQQLFKWLDPKHPPQRALLQAWKQQITETLTGKKTENLAQLALLSGGADYATEGQWRALDNALGLDGADAMQSFQGKTATHTHHLHSMYRFEPARMQAILEGDQADTIKKVKGLLSRPAFKLVHGWPTDAYREKVLQWCKLLAREKLGSLAYPDYAGGKQDFKAYFAVMETLSYHDLSLVIKYGVQFGLWGMSVQLLGTEKHHRKYLKDIGSLKLPGCFAMTETGHGSNVKGLETTATYNHDDQSFTIHTPNAAAQKEYIGNAATHGRMATVFAKLLIDGKDHGVNAFIVPLRNNQGETEPGVTLGDCGLKMGLNGVDNGTIRFKNVRIPKENMLDKFASVDESGQFQSPIPSDNRRFFTMLGTLVGGRIGIPRSALSAAKVGLTIALRYADKRRQFGPDGGSEVPILNYRIHQRRLLPHLARVYAHHFALQHLTKRYLKRTDAQMQEIEALAAGLKATVTWSVRDALQECREACGGKGYLAENRIAALKDDTEIYTTFEGDNTVLMQLVAKSRLAEFRKQFGNLDAGGVVRYVWQKAKTVVSEKNPVATRRTDPEHLRDPEFHLQAFVYRENAVTESAALRIKRLVDEGLDAYDAFNVSQQQMLEVAAAYLQRVVLEQFQAQLERTSNKKCRAVLESLYQLYALGEIEKNRGWYLESGYMDGVKTKAIRKQVSQLCWDLRPDAVALTDAFAIPESCLAPIAAK